MEVLTDDNRQVRDLKERLGKHFESEIEVLSEFPVMYSGWECDSLGWVIKIQRTNEVKVVMTNHGSFYLETEEGLNDKMKEYEAALIPIKAALIQIKGQTNG